ncbi:hypothetical protein FOCG_18328 [Fusarium oxysporum f. sp. radicis-lycopersici 26381]|nr:hypothetical protein FOCG_18328 [Fusarium oxysporum f. sp. radicis-lycopersici 26381]
MSFSQQSHIPWTSLMEGPCPGQADRSFDVSSTATDPTSSGYLESTQNAGQGLCSTQLCETSQSSTEPAQLLQLEAKMEKLSRDIRILKRLVRPRKKSKYRHFRHNQAPVYIASFSLTIKTSPNTPTTPKESHDLHLSCSQVIPCTPSEERAVDEDRITQKDSENEGN